MKRVRRWVLALLVIFCGGISPAAQSRPGRGGVPASVAPQDPIYRDMVCALLTPALQNAVDGYYRRYLREPPGVAPYEIDILRIDRLPGPGSYTFVVVAQVSPYFGPHNSVGEDRVTLRFSATGRVAVEKFEHLESYALPWNYRDEALGPWPPA